MGKLNSFQGSIACFILNGFCTLVRIFPIKAALLFGRLIGDIAFYMAPRQRSYALAHLKIAFGKTKSYEEIKTIVRMFFRSYGQSIIEIARLPLFARQGFGDLIDVKGREHVDEAMKKGRGCIFLSIHAGNWELANLVGSMIGYPYNMVANDLNHMNQVAEFLNDLRRSAGCRIIHPGIGGREIIRRLKNNEIVTLVADQGGSDGVMVPFFGRPASMSTGAVRLALKYNVPIILVNIRRLSSFKHELNALPFSLTVSDDHEKDVKDNLERMFLQFEGWVKECPQDYVWPYKTWKHAKTRVAMILDDGRVGHLRQSQALARDYTLAARNKGYTVETLVVEVKFRSDFHARLLPFVINGVLLGGFDLLESFLDPATFNVLGCVQPDVVISCGSRNTAVNHCVSKAFRARSVALLPSRLFAARDFNLVVLPRHDMTGKTPPENVIVTAAAPNLMDKIYLEQNVRGLLLKYQHLKHNVRSKIALLIGGDTKDAKMSVTQMRHVFHQICSAAEAFGMDLLITTSRRTPPLVEQLAVEIFSHNPRTALLILANKTNVPEAVGGILGLSDMVFVSGESISMVSEAASSGKRTIVFPVGNDKGGKHMRFCESMAKDGFIVYTPVAEITATIDRLIRSKVKTKIVNDHEILKEALGRIIP